MSKYVSAGRVAICADCVELAGPSLLAAAGSEEREVVFPPRTFGVVPDDDAVNAIVKVFSAIFGTGAVDSVRADYLEDADDLASLFEEATARHPGVGASTRVDRIRFVDENTADVRFQLGIGGGPGSVFDGRVVRLGGRWIATREVALRVLALGGVHPRLA